MFKVDCQSIMIMIIMMRMKKLIIMMRIETGRKLMTRRRGNRSPTSPTGVQNQSEDDEVPTLPPSPARDDQQPGTSQSLSLPELVRRRIRRKTPEEFNSPPLTRSRSRQQNNK